MGLADRESGERVGAPYVGAPNASPRASTARGGGRRRIVEVVHPHGMASPRACQDRPRRSRSEICAAPRHLWASETAQRNTGDPAR